MTPAVGRYTKEKRGLQLTGGDPTGQALFLTTLLDTIPNPVFFKDAAGIYRGCNTAFADKIIGLPKENIIGHSLFELPQSIPRELAEKYHRQDLALIREPGSQFYESVVKCADGVKRHFLFNKATFCDADGQAAGIVGVMLDITARKLAEDALRHSEERYRRLFEDAVLGIFMSTPDGRVLSVNPAFARMFGYDSPEDLLSSVGDEAVRLYEDPSDRTQNIRLVRESGTPIKKETRYKRRDGSVFTGNFHAWQVKDQNDRLLYIEGFVEDITDRKQVEESLHASRHRLRFLSSRLLTAQEDESHRISMEIHDTLGQNLAVLKLYIDSIAKQLRKDQRQLSAKCRISLDLIDRIIASVRDLSRDLSPTVIQDLKLGGTLKWMLNEFSRQTGIPTKLKTCNIDALFSSEHQIVIYRIIQEALRNVQKHAKARVVSVTIQRVNDTVVMRVSDDGQGFDIDAYWQRHVAERGLGLAALDERARMLNGNLVIDSRQGGGTRITLTIPLSGEKGER